MKTRPDTPFFDTYFEGKKQTGQKIEQADTPIFDTIMIPSKVLYPLILVR